MPAATVALLKTWHNAVQVLVLSGKGGVGKSTVAAQLAWNLAEAGKEAGPQAAAAFQAGPRRRFLAAAVAAAAAAAAALPLRWSCPQPSPACGFAVAAQMPCDLLAPSQRGRAPQVGILDIDICGPSIPKMLGLEGEEIHQSGSGWSPVYPLPNLAVMSIGFLLTDPNDAVVWRGPRKSGLIKQFLKDVDWGSLDYLARFASRA